MKVLINTACFVLLYVSEKTTMHLNSLRNRKQALKIVQELDAFPKVAESYQETTATGGSRKYNYHSR